MSETLSSKDSLLLLALPHHAASISSAEEMLYTSNEFDLNYYCIKGKMTPVTGNSWTYEEELTSIAFGDEPIAKPSPSSATKTAPISSKHQTISEVADTVSKDAKINLPDNNSGAYSFGKQIARLILQKRSKAKIALHPQNRQTIPALMHRPEKHMHSYKCI